MAATATTAFTGSRWTSDTGVLTVVDSARSQMKKWVPRVPIFRSSASRGAAIPRSPWPVHVVDQSGRRAGRADCAAIRSCGAGERGEQGACPTQVEPAGTHRHRSDRTLSPSAPASRARSQPPLAHTPPRPEPAWQATNPLDEVRKSLARTSQRPDAALPGAALGLAALLAPQEMSKSAVNAVSPRTDVPQDRLYGQVKEYGLRMPPALQLLHQVAAAVDRWAVHLRPQGVSPNYMEQLAASIDRDALRRAKTRIGLERWLAPATPQRVARHLLGVHCAGFPRRCSNSSVG